MFNIPNIEQQLQGIKDNNLDIFDDSKLFFYLKPEYKEKWKYITKISIRNSYCTKKFIIKLGESPYAQNIKELDISRNYSTVNDEFVEILIKSKYLYNLETVDFTDTDITNESIIMLLQEPSKMHLKKLIFYSCLAIDQEIMQALADSQTLIPKIIQQDNEIIKYGIQYLDLRATSINDQAIKILSQTPNSEALEYLDISINEYNITNKSMEYIKGSSHLKGLKTLKVASCKIDNQGLAYLSQAECLVNLEVLDISNDKDHQDIYNYIDDEGISLLSKSNTIEKLKFLNVRATHVSSEGFQDYFNSDCCKYLEEIKCTYCYKIDDKFLKVLQESRQKNLQNISKISISSTGVSAEYTEDFVKNNDDLTVVYSFDFDIDYKSKKDE